MSERDANALEAVERYSLYSAAAGLIPVPLVDMAAITGLQIKMLAEIAKAYDQQFEADRARAILGRSSAASRRPAWDTAAVTC